jgi:hypothetical protein
MMQFQVTNIEFDFEDAFGTISSQLQKEIVNETLGQIWEANDEEDLIEEITCATGWCIKFIDYRVTLDEGGE